MIINIRGTFGSGKTTLVRRALAAAGGGTDAINLLNAAVHRPTKADPERRVSVPLRATGTARGLLAVGTYYSDARCAGLDEFSWRGAHDDIVAALEIGASMANVLMYEGVTVSGIFQRYANLSRHLYDSLGKTTHVITLLPPPELCVERIAARSGRPTTDRVWKSVTDKRRGVQLSVDKLEALNHPGIVVRRFDDPDEAFAVVMDMMEPELEDFS